MGQLSSNFQRKRQIIDQQFNGFSLNNKEKTSIRNILHLVDQELIPFLKNAQSKDQNLEHKITDVKGRLQKIASESKSLLQQKSQLLQIASLKKILKELSFAKQKLLKLAAIKDSIESVTRLQDSLIEIVRYRQYISKLPQTTKKIDQIYLFKDKIEDIIKIQKGVNQLKEDFNGLNIETKNIKSEVQQIQSKMPGILSLPQKKKVLDLAQHYEPLIELAKNSDKIVRVGEIAKQKEQIENLKETVKTMRICLIVGGVVLTLVVGGIIFYLYKQKRNKQVEDNEQQDKKRRRKEMQ